MADSRYTRQTLFPNPKKPMFFNLLLSRAEAELRMAQQAAEQTPARANLLVALALRIVDLFESNDSMTQFSLEVKLTPEDTCEGAERVLKLRRAMRIKAPGCRDLQTSEDKHALVLMYTPHWLLGDGQFVIKADDALLLAARVPEDDSDERLARAYRLALHIDSCFQSLRVESFLSDVS